MGLFSIRKFDEQNYAIRRTEFLPARSSRAHSIILVSHPSILGATDLVQTALFALTFSEKEGIDEETSPFCKFDCQRDSPRASPEPFHYRQHGPIDNVLDLGLSYVTSLLNFGKLSGTTMCDFISSARRTVFV